MSTYGLICYDTSGAATFEVGDRLSRILKIVTLPTSTNTDTVSIPSLQGGAAWILCDYANSLNQNFTFSFNSNRSTVTWVRSVRNGATALTAKLIIGVY